MYNYIFIYYCTLKIKYSFINLNLFFSLCVNVLNNNLINLIIFYLTTTELKKVIKGCKNIQEICVPDYEFNVISIN